MNKNINLYEILKGHEGETFYSPLFGNITLSEVRKGYAYPLIFTIDGIWHYFTSDGKFNLGNAECLLFPSKDQRDWNKWIEEQKPKTPKIWSDIEDYINDATIAIDNLSSALPITTNHKVIKSTLAFLKIHQLIEAGYGGSLTDEEWYSSNPKWIIAEYSKEEFVAVCVRNQQHRSHIAFHTREQAEEFLKYPENVQLFKDYFMIP